jgi:hypothetical protein
MHFISYKNWSCTTGQSPRYLNFSLFYLSSTSYMYIYYATMIYHNNVHHRLHFPMMSIVLKNALLFIPIYAGFVFSSSVFCSLSITQHNHFFPSYYWKDSKTTTVPARIHHSLSHALNLTVQYITSTIAIELFFLIHTLCYTLKHMYNSSTTKSYVTIR